MNKISEFIEKATKTSLKYVYSVDEVEEIGATSEQMPYISPEIKSMAIIMYTSGDF